MILKFYLGLRSGRPQAHLSGSEPEAAACSSLELGCIVGRCGCSPTSRLLFGRRGWGLSGVSLTVEGKGVGQTAKGIEDFVLPRYKFRSKG